MRFNTICTLFALTLAGVSSACLADEEHPNSVRVGLYYVTYHSSADDISGPFVPPGLNVEVENTTTLYLAYVRRLSSHFDLELAAGWPPLTKTKGKGPAMVGSVPYNGEVISSARWFAPTLLLNYSFVDESHAWRPYIGVGINYTHFYDRVSTPAGDAASGGPTSIKLPDSFGPAATLGLAYHPTSRWSVNLSYSVSKVSSNLTATTAGLERHSHVDFGPRAAVLSGGYSF